MTCLGSINLKSPTLMDGVMRQLLGADVIKQALDKGLKAIEETLSAVKHDMNNEVLAVMKDKFGSHNINHQLYVAGVMLFFYGAQQEAEEEFKRRRIPEGMVSVFSSSIMDELKKLDGVQTFLDGMHKDLEKKEVKL